MGAESAASMDPRLEPSNARRLRRLSFLATGAGMKVERARVCDIHCASSTATGGDQSAAPRQNGAKPQRGNSRLSYPLWCGGLSRLWEKPCCGPLLLRQRILRVAAGAPHSIALNDRFFKNAELHETELPDELWRFRAHNTRWKCA